MDAKLLNDPARAGVYHLTEDARQLAETAAQAGLAAFRIDIGHAHDKEDFMGDLSKSLKFPATFGGNWDALADSLRDLSWLQGKGYVIILEKSKHFAAHHKHEFEEAIDLLKEASTFWKAQNKPFWALIGGPDGWESGCPKMPS